MNLILENDIKQIYSGLSEIERKKLSEKTILVTGFAGSLGYMLLQFFNHFGNELSIKKVYCIDNYSFGKPYWIDDLTNNKLFEFIEGDVTLLDFSFVKDANLIFHMASLASPVYYRLHPIETIDADVVGLRRLLDFYKDKDIFNLLFYSTSEIYGDPVPHMVPTPESYWGNVNTSGPRACYDESKRFGETLCYNFHNQLNIPVTVVRPFNNFGPGLRTNDQRVVADFAHAVLTGEDIVIYSDGKATRTFCYITDTTIGCLKCALLGKYDIFNIGMDRDEMTVLELAEIYKKVGQDYFNYKGNITYKTHRDIHYLTDNPQRRCPDISKAKSILNYNPKIEVPTAVLRYLTHLKEKKEM